MKAKFISQSILSLFVLAVGFYALYEYRKAGEELKEELLESSLVSQDLKDLRAFKIIKEDKTVIELVEEAGDWKILEPVRDLADWAEVSRWFDEIKNLKARKVKIGEVFRPEEYYLDDASSVEMKFAGQKGQHEGKNGVEQKEGEQGISFSISKKSSFDGKYFVQKGEELFIVEPYVYYETNDKDFESFRSKKLLPSLEGHPDKIQFKGKEDWTIYWFDHRWSLKEGSSAVKTSSSDKAMAKQPGGIAGSKGSKQILVEDSSSVTDLVEEEATLPLDHGRLDEFWNELSGMKVSALKEKVSLPVLKKYGLNRPQRTFLFYWPTREDPLSLRLSHFKDGKAFLSASSRDFILELSQTEAEKLLLKRSEIHDHNFPFNFRESGMEQVQLISPGNNFSIHKTKEGWKRSLTGEVKDNILSSNEAQQLRDGKPISSKKKDREKEGENSEDSTEKIKIEDKEAEKLGKSSSEEEDKDKKSSLSKKTASVVDKEKLEELLAKIKGLRGIKYKKVSQLGKKERLISKGRSIRIKTKAGEELFSLEEVFVNKGKESGEGKSWLKTNLWGEFIQLDSKELDEIFSIDIFL